jgi:hypothetical protein
MNPWTDIGYDADTKTVTPRPKRPHYVTGKYGYNPGCSCGARYADIQLGNWPDRQFYCVECYKDLIGGKS